MDRGRLPECDEPERRTKVRRGTLKRAPHLPGHVAARFSEDDSGRAVTRIRNFRQRAGPRMWGRMASWDGILRRGGYPPVPASHRNNTRVSQPAHESLPDA